MTLTDTEIEQIRTVVREELRRNKIGGLCPNCDGSAGIEAHELDRADESDAVWEFACMQCGHSDTAEAFDPTR